MISNCCSLLQARHGYAFAARASLGLHPGSDSKGRPHAQRASLI